MKRPALYALIQKDPYDEKNARGVCLSAKRAHTPRCVEALAQRTRKEPIGLRPTDGQWLGLAPGAQTVSPGPLPQQECLYRQGFAPSLNTRPQQ